MQQPPESPETETPSPAVSLREAFGTWCRVAALSFGGPAGQIAVMHRIIVDEKKWISEARFLHALNYCMLLPGPEAQQLATYIGWLMHRTAGGLLAGCLFVLPGFVSILILSIVYACFEQSNLVQAIFFGLKPAVMAIVLQAVIRIGKRILKNSTMVALAAAAFVAIFFFDIPFPALIFSAGLIGYFGGRLAPERFCVIKEHGSGDATMNKSQGTQLNLLPLGEGGRRTDEGDFQPESPHPVRCANHPLPYGERVLSKLSTPNTDDAFGDCESTEVSSAVTDAYPLTRRSLYVSAICLSLWFGPLIVIWFALGPDSVYFQEGTFFSQAAVVTFGGAYSVLAYIAQQAVENFGWLRPGEMLDGLGMAETTPGPLIMVVQFVGFMGAYRNPGPFSPIVGGILGSLLTTWVTFVPCFYWIFLGAPFIERLRGNRLLSAALSAITAAVVGVILNLAVWFSLHTLFGQVMTTYCYGLRLQWPELTSVDPAASAIAVLACLLTFRWKQGMPVTLGISAATGAAWFLLTRVG
jgi:chromate transporter